MKRRIGKLVLVLAIGFLALLIYGTVIRRAKAEEAAIRIRILPNVVMTDIWGSVFSTDQITSGPLLITFFDPECDHCRHEISSLLDSGIPDSKLTILLVSYADSSEILSFIRQFDIDETSSVHVLHDPDFRMSELFRADVMPSNFIYDDSLHLVKVFKGSTRPEALMRYVFKDDKHQEN